MDIAREIDLAEAGRVPLHATRSSTRLPRKSIADEYRDLREANRVPANRRYSDTSLIWDEYDLRQAQMEPEFEGVYDDALQADVIPEEEEDDLDTSDDDLGTIQKFTLYDKDYIHEEKRVNTCEDIFDFTQLQANVLIQRRKLVAVPLPWADFRDVFWSKLEEMQRFNTQFEIFKRDVAEKKKEV